MQNGWKDAPGFSRRWTVAGVAAAAIAVAGAALAWHGRAHAAGPGHHRLGGWEEVDPEAMGRRIEAMAARRLADIDATPEQRARLAERRLRNPPPG